MSISPDFENALTALFTKLFGKAVALQNIHRLSGGASQETWLLETSANDYILRRAPGGTSAARSAAAIGLPTEAELIRLASTANVPVPDIVHVLQPEDSIGDGFIMSKLEGETIARPILRDDRFAEARKALTSQCAAALAQIHALPTADINALAVSQGTDQIAQYEEIFRGFNLPRPVFELALAWLKQNAPAPFEPVLVHGDFRLGNLMVDETGLAGILDWELAHLGDPREDIAWICVNSWRFGQSQNRVGGFGHLPDFLQAYHAAGGASFDPVEIDWWEVLGTLKWGIMCMIMYEAFRSGADPSVERAAIGRRVSETEIDLLNLLERYHA